ncbi:MAG: transposase [Aquabacterium sp.]|nr:transposase [Aquabacterium sp.]
MEHPPNSTGSPTLLRRKYSAEFKASVVEQCSQPGHTTAAEAKRHGIQRQPGAPLGSADAPGRTKQCGPAGGR